jgi:hypothetical protein
VVGIGEKVKLSSKSPSQVQINGQRTTIRKVVIAAASTCSVK